MKLHEQYFTFIKRILTRARLEHSLGVMDVMGDLAEIYGLDPDKARLIGLLHDAGKDLESEQQNQLFKAGRIKIHHECDWNYHFYLHGPVGAVLVQNELGIKDELILDAIANHTYYGNGKFFDHPMCWCLRFADVLEPNRDFRAVKWLHHGLDRLRETVFAGQLDEAAYLLTGWILQWFQEDGLPIHPNMITAHHNFSKMLNAVPMVLKLDVNENHTGRKTDPTSQF